jgi:RNA polymerase sigma factor (sigma-70 family)
MSRRKSGHLSRDFESHFATHFREITGYVRRRVPTADVDDVVAQVFTVSWRRFAQVPPPPEDRLWLFGVARRCVSEAKRRADRHRRLATRLSREGLPPQFETGADSRHMLVLDAMASIPVFEREALQLILWDGLTHAEAATVMECTVAAFESRYRRARNAVRDAVTSMTATPPLPPAPVHSSRTRGELQ